jgi:hypothetical protein
VHDISIFYEPFRHLTSFEQLNLRATRAKDKCGSINIFEVQLSQYGLEQIFIGFFHAHQAAYLISPNTAVPRRRIMAEWHRSRGQGRSAFSRSPPGAPPATSAKLYGLEGLLRKPDPKITLSLPEDAELIDQLHKLTGKMPKFAQFNPPPAAPTPAPSPSPQRMEAEAAQ